MNKNVKFEITNRKYDFKSVAIKAQNCAGVFLKYGKAMKYIVIRKNKNTKSSSVLSLPGVHVVEHCGKSGFSSFHCGSNTA